MTAQAPFLVPPLLGPAPRRTDHAAPTASLTVRGPAAAAARRRALPRLGTREAHLVLAVWAVTWFLLMARHGGISWHYFAEGARFLFDPGTPGGGLHVYAAHPELQMGPLAFLASALLLVVGPGHALLAAQLTAALAGLLVLVQVGRLGDQVRPAAQGPASGWRLLLAGAAFIPVWMNLAVCFVHVDDVLALVLATFAVRAAVRRQGLLAGILIGLSVDAKPWALPFVALLLVLPGRSWLRPLVAAGATVLVAWLPFVLADPATITATHFTIPNSIESTLRVLGITDPVTPWWVRPAQAALGLALAAAAVRRGRWAAVVLLCTGARVVLDPGTYTYYAAGLIVGALLWDQLGTRRVLPVWTWACAASVFATEWLPVQPQIHGYVRLVFVAICVDFLVLRRPTAGRGPRVGPRHAGQLGYRPAAPVPLGTRTPVPSTLTGRAA